jgi:PAS domain S-box-containing protein
MRMDEPEDPLLWRDQFSQLMLAFGVIVLPLTMIYVVPVFITEGRYALIAIVVACWLFFLSRLLGFRPPLRVRWYLDLIALYTMPVAFIVSRGPFGTHPAWLVMSTVIAGVLLGTRGAIASALFNAALLWALYGLMGPGNKAWASVYAEPMAKWILFVMNIPVLSLVSGLVVVILLNRLDRALRDQFNASERLRGRSEELEKAYKLLQGEMEQRKIAEEALIQGEAQYRLLAENATDVILTTDMELNVTYVSPSIYRTCGYTQQEFRALKLTDQMTPNSSALATRVLAEELAVEAQRDRDLKRSGKLEVEMIRKDGSTYWSEVNLTFIRDPEGKAVGILGVGRDVTERKRAAQALQESEERYRQIAKCVPDLIWTIDLSGRHTYANSAVERTHGWTVEEFLNLNFTDVVTPQQASESWTMLKDALERVASPQYDRNTIRTFESEELRKDGSTFWADVSAAFLWSDDGQPVGVIGITRDITERKRAEEALKKSEEEAKRLAHENAVIAEIGRIISSTLNIEEVYKLFSEKVGELISFNRIGITLIHREEGKLSFPFVEGISVSGRQPGDLAPLAGTSVEMVLQAHKGLIIEMEDENEVATKVPELLPEFRSGIRSALTVPLIFGDEVIEEGWAYGR